MELTYETARDLDEAEREPRSVDLCPSCGSGHTTERLTPVYKALTFRCDDCRARWIVDWHFGRRNNLFEPTCPTCGSDDHNRTDWIFYKSTGRDCTDPFHKDADGGEP